MTDMPVTPTPLTPTRRGPLAEVKVVEAATYMSGPYAGMMLADLGAQVVKIEAVDGRLPSDRREAVGVDLALLDLAHHASAVRAHARRTHYPLDTTSVTASNRGVAVSARRMTCIGELDWRCVPQSLRPLLWSPY